MINLSVEKCADLQERAYNYLRFLALEDSYDIQDCISSAFVFLCAKLDKHPEDEHENLADKFWKCAVQRSSKTHFEKSHKYSGGDAANYEGMTDGAHVAYERRDFIRSMLEISYEILSDDEIITILTLIDCHFRHEDAAQYLGLARGIFQKRISRIRAKMAPYYPEVQAKPKATFTQPYIEKTDRWYMNLMAVEVVPYLEYDPTKHDFAIQERTEAMPVRHIAV